MKVIFLDFDGVLVIPQTRGQSGMRSVADPNCVAALNSILTITGAFIVVSSSWRGTILSTLKDTLNGWGVTPGKVLDVTPRLRETGKPSVPRGREIQAWLDSPVAARRGGVEQFVILDDGDDMGHLLPRLVQTNYHDGLTLERAELAINLLNEEVNNHGSTKS